jgi:hypothetical protein
MRRDSAAATSRQADVQSAEKSRANTGDDSSVRQMESAMKYSGGCISTLTASSSASKGPRAVVCSVYASSLQTLRTTPRGTARARWSATDARTSGERHAGRARGPEEGSGSSARTGRLGDSLIGSGSGAP